MNMNQDLSADQLRELLGAQHDDHGSHSLWVDQTGDVHIDVVGDDGTPHDEARLWYAPFEAGIGFVGEDAASDPELIEELLASLVGHWAAARNAPPGIRIIDLDDPESGPDWTLTKVITVDDELLASLSRPTLH